MATAKKASGKAKKAATPRAKKPAAKKSASAKPAKKPAAKKPAAPKRAEAKPSARAQGKTIEQYIAGLSGWQREAAAKLDALVRGAAPDVKASIKWGQPVYDSNGPMMWLKAFSSHVSLGFWRGAEMSRVGELEGDGDRMRHVKVHEGRPVDERFVRSLVAEALALNARKGDPTRRR